MSSVEIHCSRPEYSGSGQSPPNLLLEHFFDLPDLLFNFASVLFGFALSL
jgi:hypothetical protein